MDAIRDLPLTARKSITFDRGAEFVSWPHLKAEVFRKKMMEKMGRCPYPHSQ
ncbi:MAG: hypothetical protein ABJ327_13050 [Litoreibacter sp.]